MNLKKSIIALQSILLAKCLIFTPTYALETTEKLENKAENNSTKISVIVPVYNGKDYLDECLNSIQNQTFKNIEIICVNDGSTDNSLDILKKHQEKDPRIKIIDKENTGEAGARQKGLEEASSECVTFVDQDDKINPQTYEIAYEQMANENADIVVWGWKNFTDGENKIIRNDCIFDKKTIFKDWYKAKTERASIYVWNKLYKRSLITENNIGFNTELKVCDDEGFNLCVYPYAKKIVHIPYTFYYYRMNNNSSLFKFPFKKTFTDYAKMIKSVYKFYQTRNIETSTWQKIKYFKVYRKEVFSIIKTWLSLNR